MPRQRRCVAIHQLDIPWTPKDLEQRNGRGIRKGNEIAKLFADNKVDIINYAVEKSLDSYKFNLLHKQAVVHHPARKKARWVPVPSTQAAWTSRAA